MTPSEIHALDSLIAGDCSFAIYRLPGEKRPVFQMQTKGRPLILNQIDELNSKKGFVFSPFHITGQSPLVLIVPDCFEIPINESAGRHHPAVPPSRPGQISSLSKKEYGLYFSLFMDALHRGQFEKLVLSRQTELERREDFSPAAAFATACRLYPNACVYLCHTPITGTWLGSTPEILLSGKGRDWKTVALAGTMNTDRASLKDWDSKNIKEQSFVGNYIMQQLGSFGLDVQERELRSMTSGSLSHLVRDFDFTLDDNSRLGSLLELLHPTPAVCGLPRKESFDFILNHEGYDRSYYSGFLGNLAPDGQTDIYVNLRCMKISDDRLTLFAGGGLVVDSTMDDEYRELNDKLQTMLALTKQDQHVLQ